jgi:hypothetical protein
VAGSDGGGDFGAGLHSEASQEDIIFALLKVERMYRGFGTEMEMRCAAS